MARDLHDGVGQSLAALKLQLGMIANKVKAEYPDANLSRQVEGTVHLTAQTIEEIRGVLFNLKPMLLQEKGLSAAIEAMLQNLNKMTGIKTEYNELAAMPDWDETAVLNLYRVIQECVTNIIKHAMATELWIHFTRLQKNLYQFQVSDNGIGFKMEEVQAGLGVNSIQERLQMLGGKLRVITAEGEGTTLIMEVPYED